ncbi:MAG: glycoside hydrolase family 3 C-terminal domain-containing protein [Planctomycetia bacterium]|nr:glycoside hydrolase family 3 C-terminal domain-containing protein [Planctomycetia bacterium]
MKKVSPVHFCRFLDRRRRLMSQWWQSKTLLPAPAGRASYAIAAVLALAGLAVYAWPAQAVDRTVGKRSGVAIHRDWMNPRWSVHKRIAALMAHMTLPEKVGQLLQVSWIKNLSVIAPAIKDGMAGSLLGFDPPHAGKLSGDAYWRYRISQYNSAQKMAVADTRLGIPLLFGSNVLHGFTTTFPIPLALSCSWNPHLVERCERVSAREATAAGVNWTFAPMSNISHDPRWGRVAESFGEDPYLNSAFTFAAVRGFQGKNPAAPERLIACLKHYVGYGAVQGGRDYNQAEINRMTLWNYYLPAYLAGIRSGALTIMSAFSSIGATPCTADRYTLHDILVRDWGFRGIVVSDWRAVQQLVPWGYAYNNADAARRALYAGVDMEMASDTYKTLVRQVRDGKVPVSEVNTAVRRVLRVKFRSGLFAHPYVSTTRWQHAFLKPAYKQLALRAARRSCVLLKNAQSILPLSHFPRRVAIIGPLADSRAQFLGCWHSMGTAAGMVSLPQVLRAELPANVVMTVVRTGMEKTTNYHRAVALAKHADLILMMVGEKSWMSGENTSCVRIGLPGKQQQLFNAVAATGKPIITLLFNGRPLAIPGVIKKSTAVLECWQLGTETAPAISDILLGKYNPSGKITMDFPRSVGQIPVYYDHLNTGRPTLGKYIDGSRRPEFCFGYGLSYTTFKISPVTLSTTRLNIGDTMKVSAVVTNTGHRAGTDIVQLYIRGLYFKAGCRPVRELKGFQRVHLLPGQSKTVTFTLGNNKLGYYNRRGQWLVAPSPFDVWISGNSSSGTVAHFILVPAKSK